MAIKITGTTVIDNSLNLTNLVNINGTAISSLLTSVAFGDLTTTPTTLAGYGITDAEASDTTILKDADIGVNVQAYDATYVVDADIGVNVMGYDATMLVDADIGVNVQAYNANYVVDATYVATANDFTTVLKNKLDALEASATADQTGAEIKAAYEAETNAFTDAQFTKLGNIETAADVTDATNVTAAGALMDSEVTNLAAVKAFDAADYATAAQGTAGASALQPNGDGSGLSGITDTTYSAGSGLDLSTTTFSIEADLRDGITHVGLDAGDYIGFSNNASMNFFVNAGERVRIEADGDIHADGNVIAYSTTISDERLKTDIVKIDGALDKVNQLNGYTFTYKADGKKSAGVIAQEVQKVLPSAIVESKLPLKMGDDETEYMTVQYDQIIGLLIEAVKELKEEVAQLKGK